MKYSEFVEAAEEAVTTIKRADEMVEKLLPFMVGRLKKMKNYRSMGYLAEIKKELKDFDSRSQEWKS